MIVPSGKQFGNRRLKNLLNQLRLTPVDQVLNRLVAGVDEVRGELEQDDDFTKILAHSFQCILV